MQRVSGFFVALMQRYLPDPWLFAIVLTFVVFLMGIGLTGSSALDMVQFWGEGLFGLLEFSMQMVLILVTGYVLARTRIVRSGLEAIARRAGGPASAIVITTVFATLASFVQWGFGLIIGALLATEMARQVRNLDYRLVIASAYSGFLVWHAGFSGSVPLVIATPGHFLEDAIGVIPASETIFAPYNLVIAGTLLVVLPFVNRAMLPPEEKRVVVDPEVLEDSDEEEDAGRPSTPAEWLEKTPWLSGLVGIAGVIYLLVWFVGGGGLNLNIVILIFLIAGIIFHVTPRSYLDSLRESVGASAGIILQFPFYAGVIGMMGESGLIEVIANWFNAIATPATLPFWAFISGGIVNFFAPSGGGQWAIQGPVMVEAAQQIGADIGQVAMGVAWGDAWTNMVQPFWLLPALGIAGLKARDVMGYCVMALIVSGVIITAGLLLLT